jgi:cobalt/nickel transport protein
VNVISNKKFYIGTLLISLLLAGVVSFYASSNPDGLEKVAETIGFIETAKDHTIADGPLADYGVKGVDSERLSVGLSGVIGVLATAGISVGLFYFLRKDKSKPSK